MAHFPLLSSLLLATATVSVALQTCPGIPGYCSESFVGHTCNVVCARGRNNVPLCQSDGTWSDIPRCIEHDPGVEEQITGFCPGIPGYCSQSFYDGRCTFDCPVGEDINSKCTHDGTWDPYPTCQGDIRETQDGCSNCPGPNGDFRNRTAEEILKKLASKENNEINHNRVPKAGAIDNQIQITDNGIRKSVPSFAGQVKFGKIPETSSPTQTSVRFGNTRPSVNQKPTQQKPVQQKPAFTQQRATQQTFTQQKPTQNTIIQQQPAQQTFTQQRPTQQRPTQQTFTQQRPTQQQIPRQQQQQQQQQSQGLQPGLNAFNPRQAPQQPLTVFDQIKNRINQGQKTQQQQPAVPQTRPPPQTRPATQTRIKPAARPTLRPRPISQVRTDAQGPQPSAATPLDRKTFGPFQSVDLTNSLRSQSVATQRAESEPQVRPRIQPNGFFGEFEEVKLQ